MKRFLSLKFLGPAFGLVFALGAGVWTEKFWFRKTVPPVVATRSHVSEVVPLPPSASAPVPPGHISPPLPTITLFPTAPLRFRMEEEELYVSKIVQLAVSLSIIDLQVQKSPRATPEFIRAVALASDGKFLTSTSLLGERVYLRNETASGHNSLAGWLARNENWTILSVRGEFVPVRVAAPARLNLEDGPCLVPVPKKENAGRALTALPVPPPSGIPAEANSLWITVSPEELLLGNPVLTSEEYLIGLVAEIRPEAHLAKVTHIAVPMPLLDEAVHTYDPIPLGFSPPPDPPPFRDPAVDAVKLAQLKNEKGKQLIADTDTLLKKHDSSPLVLAAAVEAYFRAEDKDRALATAHRLTEIAPKSGDAWFAYAGQLVAQEQFAKAIDAYQIAADCGISPRKTGLPTALCFIRLNDYPEAIEQLTNVTRIDPENYDAWIAMGDVHSTQNKTQEAIEAYLKALRLNPQGLEGWTMIARCYTSISATDAAIESYTQLSLLAPENPSVWYNFGLLLKRAGKLNAARNCFVWVVGLDPKDNQGRLQLASLDLQLKKTDSGSHANGE